MSNSIKDEVLEGTVARLYSQDANDRVKAAAELGEIGTPEVAPELLKVAYEDEASTVRQMAIQAYAEILEDDSLDDIVEAADNHFDTYVRMYAITVLGRLDPNLVKKPLQRQLENNNSKLRATAIRAMIHAGTESNSEVVFNHLKNEEDNLVKRNCIEALALWRYKDGQDHIKEIFNRYEDKEIKTISAFYLASFNDDTAKNYLKEEKIDRYFRIKFNDETFRGKDGLLKAVEKLT